MSELFTYGEVGGVGGNSGPYPDAHANLWLGRRVACCHGSWQIRKVWYEWLIKKTGEST